MIALRDAGGAAPPAEIYRACLTALVCFLAVGTEYLGAQDTRPVFEPVATLRHANHPLFDVAFSRDGEFIAVAGGRRNEGSVQIWQTDTREVVHVLRGHTAYAYSVAFSPDGGLIASGGADNTVRIYERESGKELHLCRGHSDRVLSVAFAPDGSMLASASYDGSCRLWTVATGVQQSALTVPGGEVYCLAFSPDGKNLATGGADAVLRVWEVSSQRQTKARRDHGASISSLAFSPDGGILAAASGWHDRLSLWDLTSDRLRRLSVRSYDLGNVRFSADGKFVACGDDSQVNIYDLSADAAPIKVLAADRLSTTSVAFSQDGMYLAAVGWDGALRLWAIHGSDEK